jgi:hypothetical protein
VHSGLDKFVIERVQLAWIERITQLADQIAGSDQAGFGVCGRVIVIIRHWETGELDGVSDTLLVYARNGCKTLSDHNLPALYMIGH